MSKYISIRNDLYERLDNMRKEKAANNSKEKSFSEMLDILFNEVDKLNKIRNMD